MKPLIFVCGPLMTGGEPERNIARAMHVGHEICDAGGLPFIPHLYTYMNKLLPHPDEWWASLVAEYLPLCDAVYVFDINSHHGRKEMEKAQHIGKPIFFDMTILTSWIKEKLR